MLAEGYDFVLMALARFQTDTNERRFEQYRQMSGGRFLVSAKDVNCSGKIVKIKSHAKVRTDIDESVRPKETIANKNELMFSVKTSLDGMNSSTLTQDTKQVVNHVPGYIAKKQRKAVTINCCELQLLYEGPSNSNGYIAMSSRGGMRVPSRNLGECVELGFAPLHNNSKAMQESNLLSRHARELILKTYLNSKIVCCENHNSQLLT